MSWQHDSILFIIESSISSKTSTAITPDTLTEKTGIDPSADIANQQNIVLSRALSADIIVKIYNDSYLSPSALKLDAYLSALKGAVWKPLAGDNGMRQRAAASATTVQACRPWG